MTTTAAPQLAISRIFEAPRARVYRAFTDPDQVSLWWGPTGSSRPRDEMEFDVRAGGQMRWSEVSATDPDVRVDVRYELKEVVDDELLDGIMYVDGQLPGSFVPFETRMRIEFHDEADGRTRLEVREWVPEYLVAPSENGWDESFTKLDAVLASWI
jgi:uncharacterized protein YndB with AHSA1/START domain